MADLNPPRLDPASMAWNTVASYSSYEEAQAAVTALRRGIPGGKPTSAPDCPRQSPT